MIDLSDPISRQQAITALRALSDGDGYINAPHEVVTDVVRGLPPVRAEHEQTTQSEQGDSDKFGVKTSETCEDCISRQAAIDAIAPTIKSILQGNSFKAINVIDKIRNLPSAQPENIRCAECKWFQCNMRQDGYLPKGVDEFECRHWCGYCDPTDFCSYAERRTNG